MGDRVLVVGGGQGIGKAIADAVADRAVVWTRRTGVDASDPNSLQAAFAAFTGQHGVPAALVHCVGDFAEVPLLQTDPATWRHLFTSNVDTLFHCVRTVVPAMVQRGSGRVLLFAAAGVDRDRAMLRAPAYFAAKAAVVQFARSLAGEVARSGITVNVIAPGLIAHPHSHRPSQDRMLSRVPMGRLGTTADIVGLALHLLSDAAAYTTGQVFTVDGGLQL